MVQELSLRKNTNRREGCFLKLNFTVVVSYLCFTPPYIHIHTCTWYPMGVFWKCVSCMCVFF